MSRRWARDAGMIHGVPRAACVSLSPTRRHLVDRFKTTEGAQAISAPALETGRRVAPVPATSVPGADHDPLPGRHSPPCSRSPSSLALGHSAVAPGAWPRSHKHGWRRWTRSGGAVKGRSVVSTRFFIVRRGSKSVAGRRRSPTRRAATSTILPSKPADDAVVAILAKLHHFRGDSLFTTWA